MQNQDLYKTPTAPVRDGAQSKAKAPGSPVLAVLVGLGVDFGGTLLVGLVMLFFYAVNAASHGMPPQEIEASFRNVDPTSWFSIVGTLLGTFCSLFGGLACATIARRNEMRLGGILAVLTLLIGGYLSWELYPLWLNAAMSVATVAAVLSGAAWGRKKNASGDVEAS